MGSGVTRRQRARRGSLVKGGGDLQKLLRFCSFFFFVAFSDSFAKETNALTTSHTNLTLDQNCKLRIWHSNVRYNVYENVVLYVLASHARMTRRGYEHCDFIVDWNG